MRYFHLCDIGMLTLLYEEVWTNSPARLHLNVPTGVFEGIFNERKKDTFSRKAVDVAIQVFQPSSVVTVSTVIITIAIIILAALFTLSMVINPANRKPIADNVNIIFSIVYIDSLPSC